MTRRERLENKAEKRAEWAAKAEARASQRHNTVNSILSFIPPGQPILVGHHSERHHRRDLAKVDANMRKACEESALAEHHTSKAAGLERQLDSSIFSDDTDAVEQLQQRIADNEAKRDRMKLVNKLYKKKDAAGLLAIGIDIEELRARLEKAGGYWGSAPHLPYEMSNLGACIRRDQQRLEQVKRLQDRKQRTEAAGGLLIEGTGDYIRVTFEDKPAREILNDLRNAGFRWGGGSWTGERAKLPESVSTLTNPKGGA